MSSLDLANRSVLVPLEWESEHFGFPVSRLAGDALSDDAITVALADARTQGVAMVVLATPPGQVLDAVVLEEFAGRMVDQKATFARNLSLETDGHHESTEEPHALCEYVEMRASPDLIELAIASGVYSRFRVDPRFPREKFLAMYRTWIERSVRHEIAGAVLVVRDRAPPARIHGFVTVSVTDSVGKIGLIAVAKQARGCGLGRLLVSAAHDWMRERSALEARVVTQLANSPACGLYRRAGYELASVEHYYHFWPLTKPE